KSSWGINPRRSVLFYKIGGICDKGYHGLRRASRWFCKFYCSKAVIVGLIQIKTPPDSGEGEPELNGANGRRRKA
ncbi:hypothetical protein, partial [Faecalibacterium prausnitzii]|uniref:hypothetical protein n=1 Tax=Faecalibacterium prausnitzii TaxID=853 RepID=UPI001A9A517E